jgi:hypothetical protein
MTDQVGRINNMSGILSDICLFAVKTGVAGKENQFY